MYKSIGPIFLLTLLLASCASYKKYKDLTYVCPHMAESMKGDYYATYKVGEVPITWHTTVVPPTAGATLGGFGTYKDSDTYIGPRHMIMYKYHQVGIESKFNIINPDSAELRLRTFPTKVTPKTIPTADEKEYPFTVIAPVKHKGKKWWFKGEMEVTPRLEAVPKGKDLYLKYYIKFHPDNRYRRKLKYSLKTHKQ